MHEDRRPGLYLHVPFCRHVCHYCDFTAYAGYDADARHRYAVALTADLERVAAHGPGAVAPRGAAAGEWPVFGSVFVGGGTPTTLAPDDLAGILRCARTALPVAEDAEVSVEANPETVDTEGLATLVAAGLTRLSIGAQSFSPRVLATLGREHDVAAVGRAVTAARDAGVGEVSVDLIYGTPGESGADWEAALAEAVDLGVDHVSCYALTVEPSTRYAARVREGTALAPDEDTQAERMDAADRLLTAAGLRRYEVSNWARPGRQSRHNLVYWRGGDWLGLGTGAHGHWQGRRWWSHRGVERYCAAALAGDSTTSGEESLTAEERRTERLLMGLRTVEGVTRREVAPVEEREVARLVDAGLLTADADRLRPTPQGLAMVNTVVLALLG